MIRQTIIAGVMLITAVSASVMPLVEEKPEIDIVNEYTIEEEPIVEEQEEVIVIATESEEEVIEQVVEETEPEEEVEETNCYSIVFDLMDEREYEEFVRDLQAETGGIEYCGWEGCVATCEVYLNRALSPIWAIDNYSVYDVIHDRGQFSTVTKKGIVSANINYSNIPIDDEVFDDAKEIIEYCRENGRTRLAYDYVFFDSCGGVNGKNIVKIGKHWFGRGKVGY